MNTISRNFLVSFLLSIFLTTAYASELWTKYEGNTRHYMTLENDEGIKVKHYSQVKGDYQDLISVKRFPNFIEARKYIDRNFPSYTSSKGLKDWSVQTNATDKKNKNIWVARNVWTDEWENRYADWLKNEVNEEFYMNHNISIDCADATIGFRWIFARINSLPVANTVSDTGSLFGQFSMRKVWENLPTSANWNEDKLFLAALEYVMDLTSSKTIMTKDGFHVGITRKGLRAGTFLVTQTNGSGHIRTITQNYFDDAGVMPIFTLASTSPREVRNLYKETYIDQAWPLRGSREIMAFRWPVIKNTSWTLMERTSDPRYSDEQFYPQDQYYSFIQFVLKRTKPNFNPYGLVETGIMDLSNYTDARIQIVRDGYNYCKSHNCSIGSQGYEDWSTPSRDLKYLTKFLDMEDLVKAFDPANPGLYTHWLNSLKSTIINVEGNKLPLAQLKVLLEKKKMSINPADPILRRWGLN